MSRAHIAPVVSPIPTRPWTFSTCAGVHPTLRREVASTTKWWALPPTSRGALRRAATTTGAGAAYSTVGAGT